MLNATWVLSIAVLAGAPVEPLSSGVRWNARHCHVESPFHTETLDREEVSKCETYVVHVVAAQSGPATHARPPRVDLVIDEVLFGSRAKGDRLMAVFSDPSSGDWCGTGFGEREKGRADNPVGVPAVGTAFVVVGGFDETQTWFEVTPSGRFAPERAGPLRALVKELAEDPAANAARLAREADAKAGVHDAELLEAAKRGDTAAVDRLLSSGARPGSGGRSPALLAAVTLGNLEMTKRLLATKSKDVLAEPQAVPLAVHEKDPTRRLQLLQLLISAGVEVNGPMPGSYPALHRAAGRGDTEAVMLLLAAGANVNLADYNGSSALSHAAGSKTGAAIVGLLLAHGADPNASSHGWTPLIRAAFLEPSVSVPTMQLLIRAGARVDIPPPGGKRWSEITRDEAVLKRLEGVGVRVR